MHTHSRVGGWLQKRAICTHQEETWDFQTHLFFVTSEIYDPLGLAALELNTDERKIMSLGAGSQIREHTLSGAVVLLGWPDGGGIVRSAKPSAPVLQKIRKLSSNRNCRQNYVPDNRMNEE